MNYDDEYQRYMDDVHKKLAEVRASTKSYRQPDIHAPQFNRDTFSPTGHFRNPPTDKQYVQGDLTAEPMSILQKGLELLRMNHLSTGTFDAATHQEKVLNSGPFKAAKDRQAIWNK